MLAAMQWINFVYLKLYVTGSMKRGIMLQNFKNELYA